MRLRMTVLCILACGFLSTAPASLAAGVADVKARGKLVMLCFPHQESDFIRIKVESGLDHFEGVDFEIMDGFAKSLGVALEVKAIKPDFGALLPALLAGEGDVIASEFSVTAEREKQVGYSTPYFGSRNVVVVSGKSPVKSAADLAGKKASTIPGSSNLELTKTLKPGVVAFANFTRWSFDAVSEGKADFTVQDEPSVWHLLKHYPDLKVAFALPGVEYYAYAVQPGSDLRAALDGYLLELRKSGKLAAILERYLGEQAGAAVDSLPALPGAPATGR